MLNLASHLPSARLRMVPPPFAFRFVLFAKITSLSSKFAESFSQSIVFRCAHTVKAAGLLGQSSASGAVLQTAPTLTVRPHRNDGSQEDAKQEQPADGGLLSYTKKICLFFKKHPPGELHNQKML